MSISFYVLMGILGGVSVINFFAMMKQKKSRARSFALWFNGFAIAMIVVAVIIGLVEK